MNKYEIIRELGKGSYGSVKLARDKDTKELYAVKKVKLSCLSKSEREKALGEVKVLSSISHPNVVAYKESFQEKSSLFIVMEYIDGGDLDKIIQNQRNKLMEESEILRYFVQIVHVVNYLHTNHILHRDLKPQNVFLTKHGIVKLGDFGVAKSLDATCDLAKTIIGTPYYLSPEIWEGSPYDSKSDIWSLGCILFEMCSLHKPFEAQNATALLAMVVRGKHGTIPSRYSQNVRDLIEGMLNVAPQLRPTAKDISALPFIQKAMTDLYVKNKQILEEQRQKRSRSNQKSDKKLDIPNRHLISKQKPKAQPVNYSARREGKNPTSLMNIESDESPSNSPNRSKPSSRRSATESTKVTVASKPTRNSRGKIPVKLDSKLNSRANDSSSPSKKTRPRILFAQNNSNKDDTNFLFMNNNQQNIKSKSTPNIEQYTKNINDIDSCNDNDKNDQQQKNQNQPRSHQRSSKSAKSGSTDKSGGNNRRSRPDNFIIFVGSDDNESEAKEESNGSKRSNKSTNSLDEPMTQQSNQAPPSSVPRWAAVSKPSQKRLQPTFGEEQAPQQAMSFNDDFLSDDDFNSDDDDKENNNKSDNNDKSDNDEDDKNEVRSAKSNNSDNENESDGEDDLFGDDFIDDNDFENNKSDFEFEKASIDDLDFIEFSSSDEFHELEKANSVLRDSLQTSPEGNTSNKHVATPTATTVGFGIGNTKISRAKSAKLKVDDKPNRTAMMQRWRSEDGTSKYKSLSCKGRLLNIFDNNEELDFQGSRNRDSIEKIKSIRNQLENEIGDAQLALLYAHILTENTPMSAKFIRDFEAKNENAVELVRDLIRLEKNT